jgi:acyl-coenzyme A thioesterase PaaI-like protein
VCGTANPRGLGLRWFRKEGDEIYAEFIFEVSQQGPPVHAHGGASAAILEEAMGAAVWRAGYDVVAVNLEINYKLPVPLGQKVVITARVQEVQARKVLTTGEIRLLDGAVAVTGGGIYVPAPHLVGKVKFNRK